MAPHILANHRNVVGWRFVLNYMQTSLTHYFLESSGRAAYMETHPKSPTSVMVSLRIDSVMTHVHGFEC